MEWDSSKIQLESWTENKSYGNRQVATNINIQSNGLRLEQLKHFQYLGVIIEGNWRQDTYMNERIIKQQKF